MDQQSAEDEFVRHVARLTANVPGNGNPAGDDVDDVKIVTDTFRWLRNHSPGLSNCVKSDLLDSGLMRTCSLYCDQCFKNEPLSRSVVLQFLANFSVDYPAAQKSLRETFFNTLRNFIISSDDSKLLNNSMMLLYNMCLYDSDFRLDVLKDVDVVQKIMEHWTQNEIEYSKIFLDSIFSNSKDFIFTYRNLSETSKDKLMDLLSIWLDHYVDDVSLDVISVIIDNFFIDCTIEEITSNVANVLAKASNIDKFTSDIRKNTPLLKKSMEMLIIIHKLGKDDKDPNNEFSRVKDLSALLVNTDVQRHNRFWFKSDIIRLIANMCYNNQEHQNLMGTNNIIPILLECCSFDAKNPLMREWSLFALRNILKGNFDNQNFVANIDSVGPIDPESSVTFSDTSRVVTNDDSILNNDTMYI